MPVHFNGIDHDENCEDAVHGKCLCQERIVLKSQVNADLLRQIKDVKCQLDGIVHDISFASGDLEAVYETLRQRSSH